MPLSGSLLVIFSTSSTAPHTPRSHLDHLWLLSDLSSVTPIILRAVVRISARDFFYIIHCSTHPTKSSRSSVAAIRPLVCNSSDHPSCRCQDLRSWCLSTSPIIRLIPQRALQISIFERRTGDLPAIRPSSLVCRFLMINLKFTIWTENLLSQCFPNKRIILTSSRTPTKLSRSSVAAIRPLVCSSFDHRCQDLRFHGRLPTYCNKATPHARFNQTHLGASGIMRLRRIQSGSHIPETCIIIIIGGGGDSAIIESRICFGSSDHLGWENIRFRTVLSGRGLICSFRMIQLVYGGRSQKFPDHANDWSRELVP